MRAILRWLLRPKVLDGCRRLSPSSFARLTREQRVCALALMDANKPEAFR